MKNRIKKKLVIVLIVVAIVSGYIVKCRSFGEGRV